MLKKITLNPNTHAVKEDFAMLLQERVEKSLAVYADKTLVVGAYSGYVLFIDMHSQAVQKHRVAGEIRARMGIAGTTGVLCTYSGRMYFFDLEAKRLLGSAFLGVNCHAAPWVEQATDGSVVVVCASINSTVVVVQLRAGRVEELRRWDVGEPVFAGAGGRGRRDHDGYGEGKEAASESGEHDIEGGNAGCQGTGVRETVGCVDDGGCTDDDGGRGAPSGFDDECCDGASAMWQGDANVPTSDGEGNVYRVFFFWERVLRRGRKGRCGVFLQRRDFFKSDSPR